MTISKDVANALMAKGVLSRDDVETAAGLLAGPLEKLAEAAAAEKAALKDEEHLRDVVRAAKDKAADDEVVGNLDDEVVQEHTLEEAAEQRLDDEAAIEGAEQAINDAFDEAAAALLEAKLIDASQTDEVASAIVSAWLKHKKPDPAR